MRNGCPPENLSESTMLPMYRTPGIFSPFSEVFSAESTRHGGVSPAPFASLNLGASTADTPGNIAENRARFWKALGTSPQRVATSHQVHGSEILRVDQAGRYQGYDALITNCPGVTLAITIADCTPVLVYDPKKQALAAIHAGWRGTVQEIVLKTIQKMHQEYGTIPANCYAYVGTCIDKCSFEVGDEVAAQFAENHKWFNTAVGKYYVNLKEANQDQLVAAGLPAGQIEVSSFSTVLHNGDYFSYRLEKGQTGRMLACIGIR
jgi:polyphenol oxidase